MSDDKIEASPEPTPELPAPSPRCYQCKVDLYEDEYQCGECDKCESCCRCEPSEYI